MKSDSINELAVALSKAQSEIKGAKKTEENPFFKSSYADLASVWDACREALTSNGLSVVQSVEMVDGRNCVKTTLLHSSGQWMDSAVPLGQPDSMQSLGSAITYARRYGLAAIAGVPQVDDDAEAATQKTRAVQPQRPAPELPPEFGQTKPPSQTSGSIIRITFGSAKGKQLSEVDTKSLEWYEGVYEENVSDPSKARFKESNAAMLEAVRQELMARGG